MWGFEWLGACAGAAVAGEVFGLEVVPVEHEVWVCAYWVFVATFIGPSVAFGGLVPDGFVAAGAWEVVFLCPFFVLGS